MSDLSHKAPRKTRHVKYPLCKLIMAHHTKTKNAERVPREDMMDDKSIYLLSFILVFIYIIHLPADPACSSYISRYVCSTSLNLIRNVWVLTPDKLGCITKGQIRKNLISLYCRQHHHSLCHLVLIPGLQAFFSPAHLHSLYLWLPLYYLQHHHLLRPPHQLAVQATGSQVR